jgi:hypothetical protein
MYGPKDIPDDVPVEVKIVMAHLEPEPEALAQERERLLAELDKQVAAAQGELRQLLEKMQAVLLSRRPGAAFQPRFAREFTEALSRYREAPSASNEPPAILRECFTYLREHVRGTGLGPLLAAVKEESPPSSGDTTRQQLDAQTRIKLGNTRG